MAEEQPPANSNPFKNENTGHQQFSAVKENSTGEVKKSSTENTKK